MRYATSFVQETQATAQEPAAPPAPPAPPVLQAPRAPGEGVVLVDPGHDPMINGMPPEMMREVRDISFMFFLVMGGTIVLYPLMRALGRRLEGRPAAAALPPESAAQLQRIEHSVEAMAIEIERISESQRFLTRIQSEREPSQLPADRR